MKLNLDLFLLISITLLLLTIQLKADGDADEKTNMVDDEKDDSKKPVGDGSPNSGGVVGSTNLDSDKKQAAELQAKILAIHDKDPRDGIGLAWDVLFKAFQLFNNNNTSVKLTTIFQAVNQGPGKALFFLLRIFEFMDRNHDYSISISEFRNYFISPVARPDRLLESMFKIKDLDGDGDISKYELLQIEMLALGVNYNLHDMWRAVNTIVSNMDVSDDGSVNQAEYVNFLIYEINDAIVQQRYNKMG